MNSKNSILLVDPDFDSNTSEDCSLLIRVTDNSFSYTVIDQLHHRIQVLFDQQNCNDVPSELSDRLNHDKHLLLPYLETKVSLHTENNIAVPDDIFDIDQLNSYAAFFTEKQSKKLYIQTCKDYGFSSIFSPLAQIDEMLHSAFSCVKFFDLDAPLLKLTKDPQTTLLLDFTASSFQSIYLKEGQLIFKSQYQIENSEEFNYYLLFINQELQMDTAETLVQLSGIIHEDDANHQCITKYFSQIEFLHFDIDKLNSSILDDMPAHYYTSLLALDLCE